MSTTDYSDMITALRTAYTNSKTVMDSFREGTNNQTVLDSGKSAIQTYKTYAQKRLDIENLPSEKKKYLETILNDLGEAPIFIERNITLIRVYISLYDPDYIEPDVIV